MGHTHADTRHDHIGTNGGILLVVEIGFNQLESVR